jgi:glutathione reductase (NADPH)
VLHDHFLVDHLLDDAAGNRHLFSRIGWEFEAARRAAEYGARVVLVESGRLGGTCVNVGCVPKKLMWNAAELADAMQDARGYGFDVELRGHDWAGLKAKRDAYVERLNGIYEANLSKSKVELVRGHARLVDAHTVEVAGRRINAERIVLATGGRPRRPAIPGAELGIDSDGFFELPRRPLRVTLVGAGYVAVEFAGVLAALGCKVTILWRGATLLRDFDPMLGLASHEGLTATGVTLLPRTMATALQRDLGGRIEVRLDNGEVLTGQDTLIWAVGRDPLTSFIDPALGLRLDAEGYIEVDEFQQTNVPGVFAIGDVTAAGSAHAMVVSATAAAAILRTMSLFPFWSGATVLHRDRAIKTRLPAIRTRTKRSTLTRATPCDTFAPSV